MKTSTIMGSIHSSSVVSSSEQQQERATTTVAATEEEERNLHLARLEASRLFSVIPAEPIVVLQRRPTSTSNKCKKQQALMEMTTASICRHDVKSNNSNNGVHGGAGSSSGLPIFPHLNDGISGATMDPPSKDADYDRLETNHHHHKHHHRAPSSSLLSPSPTKRLQNPHSNTVSRDTTGAKARRHSASSIKIHRRATNRTANDNEEEQKQLMKWYDMRTWDMFMRITEARKKKQQQQPYNITPSTTTTSTPRNSNSPTTTNSGAAPGPAPPHYSNDDTGGYGQFMDPNTMLQHDDHDHDESHFYYCTASSSDRNKDHNASLLEHEMIFGELEE